MKKGKGSVNRFAGSDGKKYYPGDTVDLPTTYLGLAWLEPLEEPKKVEVPPAKVEPVMPAPVEEKPASPLPSRQKKSKS